MAAVTAFCSLLAAFYGFAQLEPAPVIGLGIGILPFLTCAWWIGGDARARRIAFAHDWGLLAWVAWPILVPWYSVKTRGRAGWRLALGLYLAILAPYAVWVLAAWLAFSRQA